MDEYWNIPRGRIPSRRRSTEESRRKICAGGDSLDPNDFRDVFGGPPRTVLLRRFSGEFSLDGPRRPESLYEEIFRSSERGMSPETGERRLPGFRIPPAKERRVRTKVGFYDDIFGSENANRMSKLQSKSSELSPARHFVGNDAIFSSFASKLRPITIPTRRHNSSPPSTFSSQFPQHSQANSYCFSPLDPIDLEPSFSQKQKKPVNDDFFDSSGIGSPSSVISSVFLETMGALGFKAYAHQQEVEKIVMEAEEENVRENPFAIEIDSHGTTETNEGAVAVDEAIAWAKEKFFSHVSIEKEAQPLSHG